MQIECFATASCALSNKRWSRWVGSAVVVWLAAGLAGCGGGDDDGAAAPPAAPPSAVTATVGPQGGTVDGPDGVQVIVPAGALTQPTAIGIARSAAGAPTAPTDNPPAGAIYEFTPHDLVFNVPVTLRMPVPAGAAGREVFMASSGEGWQVNDASVTAGVASWQRNSFSWGLLGALCGIAPNNTDPYPCVYPKGAASASATPASALTRSAASDPFGNAGSWVVNAAGTVRLTLDYSAAPDCTDNGATGGHVKLIRWNPAVSPRVVQTVFDATVALTATPVTVPPGTFASGNGGPAMRGVGSTTVDVSAYLTDAVNAFGFSFSCSRLGRSVIRGGDLVTIIGALPAPPGPHTIGGTVSGLTAAGLVLQNNGGDDLAVAANASSFTFAAPVANGTVYSVGVLAQPAGQTCTVQNGSGTANANVTNVAVECANVGPSPQRWQTAAAIETDDTGDAIGPSLAVNAAGEAVAVWAQPGGGAGIHIWANRYTPGGGWGTAQVISDGSGGAQNAQAVALDVNGNAIAVWAQDYSIWANRYSAGSGWGIPVLLESSGADAGSPQIGVDGNGNAIAVWAQREGARTNIEAARYVAGVGWSASEIIESDDSGDTSVPQIAVDAAGNAVAVWAWAADNGGSNFVYNVWANRYTPAGGWESATPLDSNNTVQPNPAPQVALDGVGNAIAVWHRPDGSFDSVATNRYTAGAGWGSASLLETDPAIVSRNARVAADAAGNAIAVWEQNAGLTANVMASRYSAGVGWGSAVLIETDNAGPAFAPQIVIDASGNATALWAQRDVGGFTVNVWANRYLPGSGWGNAVAIDGQAGPARSPALGVDASGRVIAVWEQTVGALSHLWANGWR